MGNRGIWVLSTHWIQGASPPDDGVLQSQAALLDLVFEANGSLAAVGHGLELLLG